MHNKLPTCSKLFLIYHFTPNFPRRTSGVSRAAGHTESPGRGGDSGVVCGEGGCAPQCVYPRGGGRKVRRGDAPLNVSIRGGEGGRWGVFIFVNIKLMELYWWKLGICSHPASICREDMLGLTNERGLAIYVPKSTIILFTSPFAQSNTHPQVTLNNSILPLERTQSIPGVTLDPHFKFNAPLPMLNL